MDAQRQAWRAEHPEKRDRTRKRVRVELGMKQSVARRRFGTEISKRKVLDNFWQSVRD
jgi:hypothetical protein